jgi:DNA modification methylase
MTKNGAKRIGGIADLKPDSKNANRGTQRGRGLLEKSLRQYGAGRSVLADREGNLIAGNKTVDVAAEIDLPVRVVQTDGHELVVVQRTDLDLDSSEGRGLAIADNRTGETGLEWDTDALLDLSASGIVDLEEFWKPEELEELLGEWGDEPSADPGAQIDRADELRQKWGVESGQLWSLGEHRLICGDCTDAEVVARLMDGEQAGAVVTDPPYGIQLDTDYSKGGGRRYMPVVGDDKPFDALPIRTTFDNASEQFWFGANYYYSSLGVADGVGSWLVWDKRVEEAKDAVIGSAFELCWSAVKHKQIILRHQWTNFTSDNNSGMRREHPTEKPIAMLEEIIGRWVKAEVIVIDPFLGSGTTLIACERLGRKCRAVEIAPGYVGVALERWAQMTGGEPELLN